MCLSDQRTQLMFSLCRERTAGSKLLGSINQKRREVTADVMLRWQLAVRSLNVNNEHICLSSSEMRFDYIHNTILWCTGQPFWGFSGVTEVTVLVNVEAWLTVTLLYCRPTLMKWCVVLHTSKHSSELLLSVWEYRGLYTWLKCLSRPHTYIVMIHIIITLLTLLWCFSLPLLICHYCKGQVLLKNAAVWLWQQFSWSQLTRWVTKLHRSLRPV